MARRMFQACITSLMALVFGVGVTSGQTVLIEPNPLHHPHPVPPRPIMPPRPRPIPIPRPPLRNVQLVVKKHAVEVSITDGVAVTNIDQVFFNPLDRTVEGTYIFPLEDGVALGKFSMFVNGHQVEGKLLGVDEARRIYESIVARMRDPALLEYLGTRMFRARIFPINPKSEVRIKLSYTQILRADDGLVRYRYPLNTEKHLASPIDNASVMVNIESSTPIKSVFSPSHKLALSRPSDYKAIASWEGKNVFPDRDFELLYSLSNKEFGMTVLTYRETGRDGFFLVRISPPAQTDRRSVLPKDISFVIDTSGSMAGEKISQAKQALQFCLANLNKHDRFNIISFSHEATKFRDTLVPASDENLNQARTFADDLRGNGGTNINDALLAALDSSPTADTDRPYLIVFLTDGLPTIGTTDPTEILRNVARQNTGRVRLFVFGVGHDVNTKLLDLLAEQNRGARDYVEPNEDLELRLSSFYRKVADPVLADLSLSFGGLTVYDLYPPKLGDLFAGSELVVAGRYKGEGHRAIELTGTRRGTKERFVYEAGFAGEARTHEFLPRLWATRKIGYLLDQIRLHGDSKELKDTIVTLATEYGVVTPYTAYLVTEPGGVAWRHAIDGNVMAEALRDNDTLDSRALHFFATGAGLAVTGRSAVVASKSANLLQRAEVSFDAADEYFGFGADGERRRMLVERVGTRTFYFIGDRWIDARHDRTNETRKVELFSKEYFELLRNHPDVARCFALGERVVVVIDGTTYETVPSTTQEP